MWEYSSHWTAREEALISTGRVTKENSVVSANKAIPAQRIIGKRSTRITPISRIQET